MTPFDDLTAALTEWPRRVGVPDVRVTLACPTGLGVWVLDYRVLSFTQYSRDLDGLSTHHVALASAPLRARVALASMLPAIYAAAHEAADMEATARHAAAAVRAHGRQA